MIGIESVLVSPGLADDFDAVAVLSETVDECSRTITPERCSCSGYARSLDDPDDDALRAPCTGGRAGSGAAARRATKLATEWQQNGSKSNDQRPGRRNAVQRGKPDSRTAGETAALAFERFEQRQSLAEVVVGLRLEPEVVRALFDQWTVGLTEGQLRLSREPTVARDSEAPRASAAALAAHLAALPEAQTTRISVARYRGPFQHGDREYADVVELGGFLVPGPCGCEEITRRYARGDYRVTAYAFEPPGVRWEVIVEDLAHA